MSKLVQKIATRVPQMAQSGAEFAKPRLQTFWKYARVELKPPGFSEFPQISESVSNIAKSAMTGKWKNMTVKEVWLNTLIGVEIAGWFIIGECIGKGSLVGYNIPGTFHVPSAF